MNHKLLLTSAAIFSCICAGCGKSNQHAAQDQPATVGSSASPSSTADITLPGMKPGTMLAGCYLRATIDGKKWEATEMMPDEAKLSLVTVNGKSGKSSITFVIGRNRENIGKPSALSDSNEITYWAGGGFFVGAKSGQYTVTKIDDQ